MVRLLVAAALACLLAAPAADAQAAQVSLTLTGLPARVASNDTLAAVPFDVELGLNQFICLGTSAVVNVDLAATSDQRNVTADVLPAALTFNFGVSNGLAMPASRTGHAVLAVRPPQPLEAAFNATVKVTATVRDVTGCALASDASGTAEQSTALTFTAPSSYGTTSDGVAMPAPSLALVALALAAAAVAARRTR